jgi:hypothetical protein
MALQIGGISMKFGLNYCHYHSNNSNEHQYKSGQYTHPHRRVAELRIEPRPFLRHYVVERLRGVFLPTCDVCGQVITDLDEANLIVDTLASDLQLEPAQVVDGLSLQLMAGRVIAVHKKCDDGRRTPWVPLNSVLRTEQRSPRDFHLEK